MMALRESDELHFPRPGGRFTTKANHSEFERSGICANYFDVKTKEEYWISGPKKNGEDRHGGSGKVEIDEDVYEEYFRDIRGK